MRHPGIWASPPVTGPDIQIMGHVKGARDQGTEIVWTMQICHHCHDSYAGNYLVKIKIVVGEKYSIQQ